MTTLEIAAEIADKVKCGMCKTEHAPDDLHEIGDASYCDNCTFECTDCGVRELTENGNVTEGGIVCESCDANYRVCDTCDETMHQDSNRWCNGDNGNCADCTEQDSFPDRNWRRDDKRLIGKVKGAIVKSIRPFGIELEANYDEKSQIHKAKDQMDKTIGIYEDSGAEFQTPPATGVAAETMIGQLCGALRKNHFTMGQSQGLHVHIDASDMKALSDKDRFERLQGLWLFYIVFDHTIRLVIPEHRRQNDMCVPTGKHYERVANAKDQAELEAIWYGQETRGWHSDDIERRKRDPKDRSRYRGINIHSLFHDWHLEIRYHEGIMDERAVLEWANLHCLIMDKAMQGIPRAWLDEIKPKRYKRRAFSEFLGLTQESRDYWNKRKIACVE